LIDSLPECLLEEVQRPINGALVDRVTIDLDGICTQLRLRLNPDIGTQGEERVMTCPGV
jgi:hypothetical protein